MPSLRRTKPAIHPDETRAVEAHAQTFHKLDLTRRYFGQYPCVLIEAAKTNPKIIADDIYIVDAFAGAGLHLSADHVDGAVPGTALQACYQARRVQMKYRGHRIHVRLVDLNEAFCATLVERIAKFKGGVGDEQIDVRVIPGDVADKISGLLRETRRIGGHNFSLWFFDPYGVEAIKRQVFESLLSTDYGPEILINLNVSALFRIRSAAVTEKAEHYEVVQAISSADRRLLTAVYAGDSWESLYGKLQPKGSVAALQALADCYANTFSRSFKNCTAYPLRSSGGQLRYIVHLTKSKKAAAKFAASYAASLKIGLWKGNQLNINDRARAAKELFEQLKGTYSTIDELHEAQLYPLNKSQLRVVLNEAYDLGYGRLEGSTMRWFRERQEDSARHLSAPKGAPSSQRSLFEDD